VTVVDPTSVKIRLSAPDPSFVANLGNVAGMLESPKAIGTKGIKTTPVGSGPYKMDSAASTAGSQYTFVRNPAYWNAEAFPFDKIVIKPLNDPTAILNGLRSGQLNGALITNLKNVAPAKGAGLNVTTITPGDVDGVYIWDRGGKIVPALGKVQVRQALNYAFDKQAIIKTAKQGLGTPTTQVFNPVTAAYDKSLDGKYTYDPAKATQMLAQAGYPNGFNVTIPDLSSVFPDAQAAMTQQLQDIGVKVKLDRVPLPQLIPALLGGKYAMSYFSLASFRPWDTIVIQSKKDSLWNPLKYDDPKATALIDKAQSATGPEQDQLFKQLNSYMVDQAWNAPWTTVQNAYATTKGVEFTPYVFAPVPPIYNFRQAS
jgi:peptide/nickel transport system substrate-binding protein